MTGIVGRPGRWRYRTGVVRRRHCQLHPLGISREELAHLRKSLQAQADSAASGLPCSWRPPLPPMHRNRRSGVR